MHDKRPRALVADLDGTLANIEHRRHFIERTPKAWDEFHAEMPHDLPNVNVGIAVTAFMNLDYEIIFVTGRFQRYRETTEAWLKKHFPHLSQAHLFMRADGDYRKDDVVKRQLFEELIAPSFNVRLVLEDRAHVVRMWRAIGLECWAVAQGEY